MAEASILFFPLKLRAIVEQNSVVLRICEMCELSLDPRIMEVPFFAEDSDLPWMRDLPLIYDG